MFKLVGAVIEQGKVVMAVVVILVNFSEPAPVIGAAGE